MGKPEAENGEVGRIVAHHGLLVRIKTGAGTVEWKPPRRESWVVGDYVLFEGGKPKTIKPRRNELARLGSDERRKVLAANIDRLLIVTSCDQNFKTGLIDRFIVAAGHSGIEPSIVLNKTDMPGASEYIDIVSVYEDLGYRVHHTSAVTGAGVGALADSLTGSTSALVGHSGVGKTTLLNALAPGVDRPTADVHEKTGQGRHVTSSALLVELPGGGFIIDSPGIRQFAPSGVSPEDVARHFPGLSRFTGRCRFRDCLHVAEPGCAVREAVDGGRLGKELYSSYRRLLESVQEQARPPWRQ